jgi:hypothetical protein
LQLLETKAMERRGYRSRNWLPDFANFSASPCASRKYTRSDNNPAIFFEVTIERWQRVTSRPRSLPKRTNPSRAQAAP